MKLRQLISMVMGALCLSPAASCNAQDANVKVLAPAEVKAAVEKDANATLLDVRKPEEFAQGHLKGATLMNWLDESAFKQQATTLDKSKTIYVYCRSGRRSNDAATYLAKQGYTVVDMKGGIMAWNSAKLPTTTLESDVFTTKEGSRVEITFIKHGTLMIDVDGYVIHIDPVSTYGTDYSTLPKADLILVTHEHGDHYDAKAVEQIYTDKTVFLSNGRVAEISGKSEAMTAGQTKTIDGTNIAVTATAAYNNSPGHDKFHPKGRDVGFVIGIDNLKIDNLQIYIAGDIEDIPELAQLKNIDIAFLPVNQPYTMTPEQCIKAIKMFRPRIVYPYHFGETDLSPIVEHFNAYDSIEVRIRPLQ